MLGNSVSGPVLMLTLAVEKPGSAFAAEAMPIIASAASVPNKAYFLMIPSWVESQSDLPGYDMTIGERFSVGGPRKTPSRRKQGDPHRKPTSQSIILKKEDGHLRAWLGGVDREPTDL